MTEENDIIVTMAHLRAAGYCSREPRQWMKRHGLDWSYFLEHGYSVGVLRATNDNLVERPIAKAIENPNLGKPNRGR